MALLEYIFDDSNTQRAQPRIGICSIKLLKSLAIRIPIQRQEVKFLKAKHLEIWRDLEYLDEFSFRLLSFFGIHGDQAGLLEVL